MVPLHSLALIPRKRMEGLDKKVSPALSRDLSCEVVRRSRIRSGTAQVAWRRTGQTHSVSSPRKRGPRKQHRRHRFQSQCPGVLGPGSALRSGRDDSFGCFTHTKLPPLDLTGGGFIVSRKVLPLRRLHRAENLGDEHQIQPAAELSARLREPPADVKTKCFV